MPRPRRTTRRTKAAAAEKDKQETSTAGSSAGSANNSDDEQDPSHQQQQKQEEEEEEDQQQQQQQQEKEVLKPTRRSRRARKPTNKALDSSALSTNKRAAKKKGEEEDESIDGDDDKEDDKSEKGDDDEKSSKKAEESESDDGGKDGKGEKEDADSKENNNDGEGEEKSDQESGHQKTSRLNQNEVESDDDEGESDSSDDDDDDEQPIMKLARDRKGAAAKRKLEEKAKAAKQQPGRRMTRRRSRIQSGQEDDSDTKAKSNAKKKAPTTRSRKRGAKSSGDESQPPTKWHKTRQTRGVRQQKNSDDEDKGESSDEGNPQENEKQSFDERNESNEDDTGKANDSDSEDGASDKEQETLASATTRGKKTHDRRKRTKSSAKQAGKGKRGDQSSDEDDNEKSNAKPKTRKRSRAVKKSENDTEDSSGDDDDDDKMTGNEKIKASDDKTKTETANAGDDMSNDKIVSDSEQSSAKGATKTRGLRSTENDMSDKEEMSVIDEAGEDEGSGGERSDKAANDSGTNEESGEAPVKAGKEKQAKDKAEARSKSEPGAGDDSEKQKQENVDSDTGIDKDGNTSGGEIEARDKDDNKESEGADLDEKPQKVHDVIEIDISDDDDETPKKDETVIDSKPEDESSAATDGKDEIESKKTHAKEESFDDSKTTTDSHKSTNTEAQMDEGKDPDAEIELPSSQEKQAKSTLAVPQDANIEIASDQGADAEGEKDGGKDTESGSKNPETERDIFDSQDAKTEVNMNVNQDANAEVKIIEARDTEVNKGLLSTKADTNRDLNNEKRGESDMQVEGEMGQRLAVGEDETKAHPPIEQEQQLRQKRDPEGDKLLEVVSFTIKETKECGDICRGEDAGEPKMDEKIRQTSEETIHEKEAARNVTSERDAIVENREKEASEENENEVGDKTAVGGGDKIEMEVIIGKNACDNERDVGVEGTDKSKVSLGNEVEFMADQRKAAATQGNIRDAVVSAQPTGEKTVLQTPSGHVHEDKSLDENRADIQSGSLVDTQKEPLSKISDEGPMEGSSLELGNGKNADEKRGISNKLVTTCAEATLSEVKEGTTTQKEQEFGSNSGETLQKEGYIHDGDSFHTPPEHSEEQMEDGLSPDDEAPSTERKMENEETSHVPEKGTPEVPKPEVHQNAAISNEAAVPLSSKASMLGKSEHSMDKGLAVESLESNPDGGTVSAHDKKPDVIVVPELIKFIPQKSQDNSTPGHVKSEEVEPEVEPEVESVDNQETKTHASSLNSLDVTTMSQSEQKDAVLVVADKEVMKSVPPADFRVGAVSDNHETVGIEAVAPTDEIISLESQKPWGSITNSSTQQPTVGSEKNTAEHSTPGHVDIGTTDVAPMDAQCTYPTLAKKRSRESGDVIQIEELPPNQKRARMISADTEYQSTPADSFPRKKPSEATVPPQQQPVIQTIKRCDLDKIKLLLFSAGNMVHRGRGFERIFAQYWSALSLIVAGSRSGENLVKLRGVVKSFLRTKRLKKLHNKLIMALIGRSLQDTIPLSEISGVVPPSCQGRVKIVNAKDVAPAATKQLVPLPASSLPASSPLVEDTFLQEKALPYAPLFAELSKKEQKASDGDEDELASSLPGALVVDPFIREMVQSEGLRVSENAVWLFVIAVREYIKAMLGKAIQSKEARHKHRIPPSSKAPVVLCKPGGSTKAPNPKKEKVNSNETSKRSSLGLWHDNVISPSDLSLLAANMHMSPVDSLGGTISRLACERCIFAPADISRAIRGSAFEDIHRFLTSEITAAANERQKLLKTQRSTSRTTTSPTARPADRDGQPDAAKAKKEDFSVPKTNPAPTLAPAPIPAPAPGPPPVDRRTVRSPVPGLGRGGKNLGLGRGAKNLAALMARTASATKVSSPAKPAASTTTAPQLAPSYAAPSVPTPAGQSVSPEAEASKSAEPTSNQVKGAANVPSAAPAAAQAPQNQPGSTPEKNNNANQVVIRGRGLGKKNLAAMRARIVKPPDPSDSGASQNSEDKANDTHSPSPAGASTRAPQGVVCGGGQSNSAVSEAPQLASTDETSGVTGPTTPPTASANSLPVGQASSATTPATVSHSSPASPGAGNTVQGTKSADATSTSASQSDSAMTAAPNQEKIADVSYSVPPKEDTSSAPARALVPDTHETKPDMNTTGVQPQEKTESQNSVEKSTISSSDNNRSSSLADAATTSSKEEVNCKNIPKGATSGEGADKEDEDAKPEGDVSSQTASGAKSAEESEATTAIGDKTSSSDNAEASNKTAAEENKSSAGEANELKSVEQNSTDPASAPVGTTTNDTPPTANDNVPTSDPATGDEPRNQEAGERNAAEGTAGAKGNEPAKATKTS